MAEAKPSKPPGSVLRTLVAGFVFVIGVCFTLSGMLSVSMLVFEFFKRTMNHADMNPLGGLVALAWGMMRQDTASTGAIPGFLRLARPPGR